MLYICGESAHQASKDVQRTRKQLASFTSQGVKEKKRIAKSWLDEQKSDTKHTKWIS